jgi:AcrR family transcriptional regulator
MASIRHKKDAVLDAARDCVLAVGVRRTTLTDVARRAGVSRMTIYRRWPDVQTLVADLMTREWAEVVSRVAPPQDGSPERRGTSQDAMLRAFEATLRAGHRDGSVRAGDPARQARSVLLVLQSFAMSGHIMTGDGPALSAAAFDDELRQILERYLTP